MDAVISMFDDLGVPRAPVDAAAPPPNVQSLPLSRALLPQNSNVLPYRRRPPRSTTTPLVLARQLPSHLWGARPVWLVEGQLHRSCGESPRHGSHFQVCGRQVFQQGFPEGNNSFQQLTDGRAFLRVHQVFHKIQGFRHSDLLISLHRGTAARHQPLRRRRHLNVLIFPDVLIPARLLHSRMHTVVGRIMEVYSRLRARLQADRSQEGALIQLRLLRNSSTKMATVSGNLRAPMP